MLVRRIIDTSVPLDFDIQATARLMHNLAGTAAYFGDDHIGECAGRLEFPLRAAAGPDDVKLLCRTMLSVLS